MLRNYDEGNIDTIEVVYTNFINTPRQEPESIRLFPLNDLSSMVEKLHSRFQSESQTNQKDNREILIENKDVVLSELASLYLKARNLSTCS